MTRAQSANWRSKKIVAYQIDKELFFEELSIIFVEKSGQRKVSEMGIDEVFF
jgi:hypothetical protein